MKALSPQAKGRVERLWQTLQDRLVIEFRLLGIATMEAANHVLPSLIQKHNKQFAVVPYSDESAYMKLDTNVNLDHVFTIREGRTLGQGHTISYGGKIYTLAEPEQKRFDAKTAVEVRQMLSGELLIWHQGSALMLKQTTRPERQQPQKKKASSAPQRKPANDHPWKNTYDHHTTKRNTKQSTFQDKMYSQHNTYFEAPW